MLSIYYDKIKEHHACVWGWGGGGGEVIDNKKSTYSCFWDKSSTLQSDKQKQTNTSNPFLSGIPGHDKLRYCSTVHD